MNKLSVVGLDLAKNVFQVHGINTEGEVVVRKQLRRSEMRKYFARLAPCLRFVQPRTPEQQAVLHLHHGRHLLAELKAEPAGLKGVGDKRE